MHEKIFLPGRILEREKLNRLIRNSWQDISLKQAFSLVAFRSFVNMASYLTGNGWEIRRLSTREVSRLNEYSRIIIDDVLWKQLSPLERVNLREQLSDLIYCKTFYPLGNL